MKLLHFTADWCNPCKMMKPVIIDIVNERDDLEYVMINIDTDRDLTEEYDVLAVPTFVLLDEEGAILAQISGAMPKTVFLDSLGI